MGRIICQSNIKGFLHIIILSALIPVFTYLDLIFDISPEFIPTYFIVILVFFMGKEVFIGEKDAFSSSIQRISSSILLTIYPGVLSLFLIKILFLPYPSELTLLLFLLVFGNDTFAYIFGMLFGKGNRNILAVSPNKSILGFIGGLMMAILIGIFFRFFVPQMSSFFTLFQIILISLATAVMANIGDLVESTFKRGAKIKDSGSIILGRGGLMDSIDSLLLSAPFFYILITYFI